MSLLEWRRRVSVILAPWTGSAKLSGICLLHLSRVDERARFQFSPSMLQIRRASTESALGRPNFLEPLVSRRVLICRSFSASRRPRSCLFGRKQASISQILRYYLG